MIYPKAQTAGSMAVTPAVSIEAVAALAGVSNATVSRVINGITNKMSAETRARVLQAVETLGYSPSQAGRSLRQGRSHLVALLAPDPGNAYNASVAASVEQALRAEGRTMVLGNTHEDPQVQDELLREMRSLLVGGVVMLGAVSSPQLEACLRANIPVVFLNRRSPMRLKGPYVGIDNKSAGYAVGVHFAISGYRNVVVMHGALTSSATQGRIGGFRAGFEAQGGQLDHVHMLRTGIDRKQSGYVLADSVLAAGERPDAIFCTTDEIAYGVAKRCHEQGLRIPNDIALFGFDGNPLNAYLAPWLSTIHVPYEEFGPAALRILRGLWNGGEAAQIEDAILPFRVVIADPS